MSLVLWGVKVTMILTLRYYAAIWGQCGLSGVIKNILTAVVYPVPSSILPVWGITCRKLLDL